MSYSSPYQPPQAPYPNFNYYQPDALGPARRAGVLMFVLGGLMLLGGFCCAGSGLMVPQLMQNPEFAAEVSRIPEATEGLLRIMLLLIGGLSALVGIVFIVLGAFVRRGSKAAAIIAMVLSLIAILFLIANMISSIVMAMGGRGQPIGSICIMAIPFALLVLLMVWLVGALKVSDQAASQRYAMQYWQYAQQQQMYAQQGGAYAPQQPPPYPPVPPTQSNEPLAPSQPPPPPGDSDGTSPQG